MQTLSKDPYGIFTLVLTPTRELVYQVILLLLIGSEQLKHFLVTCHPKLVGLCLAVTVGGMGMMDQGIELSYSPHIVIATHGR